MTRRRIVAGVILAAAIAIAMPFAPKAWELAVYRSERGRPGRLTITAKRFDWLPGESRIVIAQECPECVKDLHRNCWMSIPNLRGQLQIRSEDPRHPFTTLNKNFRCTCRDASYKDRP